MIRSVTTLALAALLCAGCSSTSAANGPGRDGASSRQEHLVGKHRPGSTSRILAHGVVHNRPWELNAYTDAYGAKCISVKYTGREGIPACGITVNSRRPMNAAIQQLDDRLAVVYGRAGDKLKKLSAESSGRWEQRPIYRDSSSGRRYFAIFILDQSVEDIAGISADGTRYSLKPSLKEFFSSDQD